MGFSYAYLADAQIPGDQIEAWLASAAAPESFEGWPSQWRLDTAPFPLTVDQLLQLMRAELVSRVEITDGHISLRVLADKGMDAWVSYRAHLAAAFRSSSRFGGSGRLVVVTHDDAPHDAGFVAEALASGGSSCTDMTEDEVRQIRGGSEYAELRGITAAAFGLDEFDELGDDV